MRPRLLPTTLESAWSLRLERRIEEFLWAVSELKETGETPPTEILLLEGSLERANGKMTEADLKITAAFAQALESGIEIGFRYFCERGLNYFIQGDSTLALKDFMAASRRAEQPMDLAQALVNTLLCLENLGLPFDVTLERLQSLIPKLRSQRGWGAIQDQVASFGLRQSFRVGKLNVFKTKHRSGSPVGQPEHLLAWVRSLPYVKLGEGIKADFLEDFALHSESLYGQSYRLRTLEGTLHPSDSLEVKPSLAVDRIYLWTWKWLVKPHQFPIERILSVLDSTQMIEHESRLTLEDRLMLRNALSWIGFFHTNHEAPIEKKLRPIIDPKGRDYPLLELEYWIISYLKGLKQAQSKTLSQDYLTAIESHPLFNSSGLRFKEMICGPAQSDLLPFCSRIEEQVRPDLKKKVGLLFVNEATFEVIQNDGARIISEPIARAFALLSRSQTVDCSDFVSECFGIPRYDSSIHDRRIYNLLSRMKLLMPPETGVRVKTGKLYAQGDWSQIKIGDGAGQTRESEALFRSWLRRSSAEGATPRTLSVPTKERTGCLISRDDIQRILGKSKATTHRQIQTWERSGHLVRVGKSRNIRYRVGSDLAVRLGMRVEP